MEWVVDPPRATPFPMEWIIDPPRAAPLPWNGWLIRHVQRRFHGMDHWPAACSAMFVGRIIDPPNACLGLDVEQQQLGDLVLVEIIVRDQHQAVMAVTEHWPPGDAFDVIQLR